MLTNIAAHATVFLAQSPLLAGATTAPTGGAGAAGNVQIPDTCGGAVAPARISGVFDLLLGWVKWGAIAMLTIAFFAAVGMMIWGRVTYHPRGARIGFDVLVVCLVASVIYVAGYSILQQITGC